MKTAPCAGKRFTIGFDFVSHWLGKWGEFFLNLSHSAFKVKPEVLTLK